MIKNKKGLTLVELLAVIVLISLLLGLGIPGINRIRKNMQEKSLNTKTNLIEQAAVLWGQDNKTLLQAHDNCEDKDGNSVNCYKISIEELIEDDCLDSEDYNEIVYNDPYGESMLNKCVYVYKKNNRVYAYFSTSNNCDGASVLEGGGIVIDKPNIVASDGKSSGEWHNVEDLTLNFSASSGTEIYYGFDESNVNTKATTYPVDEETISEIIYVKACKSEVCSENATYEIKLDKTPPIIKDFSGDATSMKLNVNVIDDISGIKEYSIYKDGSILDLNSEYKISENGVYKLKVCNNAGLCSEQSIIVDFILEFVATLYAKCSSILAGINTTGTYNCFNAYNSDLLTENDSSADFTFYTNIRISKITSHEQVANSVCETTYSYGQSYLNSYSCEDRVVTSSSSYSFNEFDYTNNYYKHSFVIPRHFDFASYTDAYYSVPHSIKIIVTDENENEYILYEYSEYM